MNTTTPQTPWYLLSGHVISRTMTADHASDKNLVVPGGILSKEHAEQIVHEHNTHAALVAALEAVMYTLKAQDENYDLRDSYQQGKKALAQERSAKP